MYKKDKCDIMKEEVVLIFFLKVKYCNNIVNRKKKKKKGYKMILTDKHGCR